jgi:hypothetical protein
MAVGYGTLFRFYKNVCFDFGLVCYTNVINPSLYKGPTITQKIIPENEVYPSLKESKNINLYCLSST